MNQEWVVVNTAAFASQIERGRAQHEFFKSLSDLGVRQVEVRREYFTQPSGLEKAAEEAAKWGLKLLYSVPEPLFRNGEIDTEMVDQGLWEAAALGAASVKWTRGDFRNWDADSEKTLRRLTSGFQGLLTIENDQTLENGTLHSCLGFLEDCEKRGLGVYATFDVGNWYWVGEDPLANAVRLHRYIRSVHLKDVLLTAEGPRSVFPGSGQIPLKEILSVLPRGVFTVLEYPCGDDPVKRLEQDLLWLERESQKKVESES